MLFSIAREQGIDVARQTAPKKVQEHEVEPRTATWGFFTNHLLVLVSIARNHEPTVRELAAAVGITERAVVGIINQLETDGILERRREGRRTHYEIGYETFRGFRGWTLGDWRIPAPLIDAAIETIKALEERAVAPVSARTPQPGAPTPLAGRLRRTPR
ncbi:MAG: helix-turn-helix transcriptional regulator [Chloroflexi bacterium]|nr:helix-turn-helix transcriptional regulator [Chloroflexota bacterium]